MSKKIIFGLISLVSASFFCWSAYSFFSAPLVEFVVDRQLGDIKQRINRELLRSANPRHLAPRIRSALKPVPADWTSIDLLREFAEEHRVALPQDLVDEIKLRETKERGVVGAYDDCLKCIMDSENCPISAAKVCDIALELTPAGDARSINRAIKEWQAGRPVDTLDVSLATVGLVATAATFVSAGATYSIKAGSGVIKVARKTESIGKPLWRFINQNSEGMIDFARVPKGWHMRPSAIGQAVDMNKYVQLKALASDIGAVHGSLGTLKTLRLLKHIDNGTDARRARLATEAMKDSAPKALEVLGKKRLFKQTYRLNPKITRMAGATITFFTGLLGLFWGAFLNLIMAISGLVWGRLSKFLRRQNQASVQI